MEHTRRRIVYELEQGQSFVDFALTELRLLKYRSLFDDAGVDKTGFFELTTESLEALGVAAEDQVDVLMLQKRFSETLGGKVAVEEMLARWREEELVGSITRVLIAKRCRTESEFLTWVLGRTGLTHCKSAQNVLDRYTFFMRPNTLLALPFGGRLYELRLRCVSALGGEENVKVLVDRWYSQGDVARSSHKTVAAESTAGVRVRRSPRIKLRKRTHRTQNS